MNTTPKISVIMSVYNSGAFLSESIESVLNQSFSDFEFIIIDDGSNDNSVEIINKFTKKDTRIRPIFNPRNIGYVGFIRNLNRGMDLAQGKYIARIDSDDVMFPDRLRLQYDYLEKTSDVFLVGGSFEYIDKNGKKISDCVIELNNNEIIKQFPLNNPIHHPTVMFRHNKNVHYREKALYCEDRDLWFRLSLLGKKFTITKDIVLKYRIHSSSESNSKNKLQVAFISHVNRWFTESKKDSFDSYEKFDPRDILDKNLNSFARQMNNDVLLESREIKFYFRGNDNDMKEFRRRSRFFWKKNGLLSWKAGYVYYFFSSMPTFIIRLYKKVIWG